MEKYWPLLIPFGVVTWLCFVLWIIGWATGWRRLAAEFPPREKPMGVQFRILSAALSRWGKYNNCVTAIVAAEGLYLALFWPFRFGHPPMLIPWRQFGPAETRQILFFTYQLRPIYGELLQRDRPLANIWIPQKVWSAAEAAGYLPKNISAATSQH